jgi:hypothetical protein
MVVTVPVGRWCAGGGAVDDLPRVLPGCRAHPQAPESCCRPRRTWHRGWQRACARMGWGSRLGTALECALRAASLATRVVRAHYRFRATPHQAVTWGGASTPGSGRHC